MTVTYCDACKQRIGEGEPSCAVRFSIKGLASEEHDERKHRLDMHDTCEKCAKLALVAVAKALNYFDEDGEEVEGTTREESGLEKGVSN